MKSIHSIYESILDRGNRENIGNNLADESELLIAQNMKSKDWKKTSDTFGPGYTHYEYKWVCPKLLGDTFKDAKGVPYMLIFDLDINKAKPIFGIQKGFDAKLTIHVCDSNERDCYGYGVSMPRTYSSINVIKDRMANFVNILGVRGNLQFVKDWIWEYGNAMEEFNLLALLSNMKG